MNRYQFRVSRANGAQILPPMVSAKTYAEAAEAAWTPAPTDSMWLVCVFTPEGYWHLGPENPSEYDLE